VLTVGSFNAGTAANIIPETAVLKGTVRTLSEKVRERIENNFHKLTEEICKAYGALADISYENGYPVLINDERITNIIGDAAISNSIKLFNMPRPVMGSEDFAYYGHVCSATYFFLGAGNVEKGYVHPNHSPTLILMKNHYLLVYR
jgi:amidohydrolase